MSFIGFEKNRVVGKNWLVFCSEKNCLVHFERN